MSRFWFATAITVAFVWPLWGMLWSSVFAAAQEARRYATYNGLSQALARRLYMYFAILAVVCLAVQASLQFVVVRFL